MFSTLKRQWAENWKFVLQNLQFWLKILKKLSKPQINNKKECFIPSKCKGDKNSYGDYQTEFAPKVLKITGLKLNSRNINLKRRSVKENLGSGFERGLPGILYLPIKKICFYRCQKGENRPLEPKNGISVPKLVWSIILYWWRKCKLLWFEKTKKRP
jgi:hypothetical protein